ncbi:hypothetical protein [Hydrococcus rivularis]|nr:hypothetical protein [Hydrococcus rivularis]
MIGWSGRDRAPTKTNHQDRKTNKCPCILVAQVVELTKTIANWQLAIRN